MLARTIGAGTELAVVFISGVVSGGKENLTLGGGVGSEVDS